MDKSSKRRKSGINWETVIYNTFTKRGTNSATRMLFVYFI